MTQAGTQPEIVTSVRLTVEEHSYLKALAASQHRSLSGQVRYFIAQAREAEAAEAAA